jgi:hypothetical protein
MLLCEPLNFCRDHLHFKVSMEVSDPNVPGHINNVPEYSVRAQLLGLQR